MSDRQTGAASVGTEYVFLGLRIYAEVVPKQREAELSVESNGPNLRPPLFVRVRTPAWGRDGIGLAQYLAAITDRADLSSCRVLGLHGNTDLLLDVIRGNTQLKSYVAVEPDLVTAAFFSSHLDGETVELEIRDIVTNDAAATELADPFDLAVVRTAPADMTNERLEATLKALRPIAADGAHVVVVVPLAVRTAAGRAVGDRLHDRNLLDGIGDYFEYEWELGTIPVHSVANVEAVASRHRWQVDSVHEPRRGFQQHHVVLSPTS